MKPLEFIRTACRPITAFYAAVFFSLLETLTYLVNLGGLSLNMLLTALALGLLLLEMASGRVRLPVRPAYVLLLILFLVITFSLPNAIFPAVSSAIYRRVITDIALFALGGLLIQSEKDLKGLCTTIMLAGLCLGLDMIAQLDAAEGFRVHVEGWDENEYGIMCVSLVPVYFILLKMHSGRWVRAGALLGLCAAVAAVVLTASRTAMLTLGFVLALLVFMKQIRFRAVALGVLLLVLLLPLAPSENIGRLLVLPGMANNSEVMKEDPFAQKSYELRIDVWKHCLGEMVPDHPLTGVGLGNWNYYSYGGISAHNMYLGVLGEHGVLGGLCFAGLLGNALIRYGREARRGTRQSIYAQNLMLSLAVFILGGLTLSIQFRLKLMWLLLGLPFALHHVISKKESLCQPAS